MHCRLMKESSVLAKQYRIDCGLESSKPKAVKSTPNVVITEKTDTQPNPNIETPIIKETIEEKVKPEYNRDDLKIILDKSETKYFKWAKTEKLLEICIKNKLI